MGGATEPSPSAGAGSRAASDDAGRILPAVLLGLFVILGVGGIALLTGRRQAEERPVPEPDGSPGEPPDPAFVRRAAAVGTAEGSAEAGRARPRAAWEVYSSLENQPLGSVDELLPEDSAATAFEAGAAPATASELGPESAPAADPTDRSSGGATDSAADVTAESDEPPR